MKKIIIIMALLASHLAVFSQMETVLLNSAKMQFDDGRDLPAEKAFVVTAEVNKTITLVKMQVFGNNKFKNQLYESTWKRSLDENSSVAILPNHLKLRSSRDYSFRFKYFRNLRDTERKQIRSMLNGTVTALLKTSIRLDGDRYKLLKSPSDLFESLNDIVIDGMNHYEQKSLTSTISFSSITENMLQVMTRTDLNTDSTGRVLNDPLDLLIQQLDNEIEMITNSYQYVLENDSSIPDYPVEKKSNALALNLGYAGVFNGGGFNDLDYFSGAYAGVSFPFGNRVFSGHFWNNLSISAGVFIRDFKNADSTQVSGPIVKRPLYAALGYRLFDYMKLHAGTAILEEKNSISSDGKSVYLKPFIGLSIELNLWLGMGGKK